MRIRYESQAFGRKRGIMLTANEASSIAKQNLFHKVEPYISAISEKIARNAMDGCFYIRHEFSGDELEYMADIVQYLRSIGYDVRFSNISRCATIFW